MWGDGWDGNSRAVTEALVRRNGSRAFLMLSKSWFSDSSLRYFFLFSRYSKILFVSGAAFSSSEFPPNLFFLNCQTLSIGGGRSCWRDMKKRHKWKPLPFSV